MFNKIKMWIHTKILHDADVTPVVAPAIHQEDTQSVKARVRRMFEEQKKQMNMRAKVAHGPTCESPDICTKNPCFVFQPDKIVETSIVEIPKSRRTHVSMGKYKD